MLSADARIQHLYTYSPLEPWEDRIREIVGRRVLCHVLIDRAPDEAVNALLMEIGRILWRTEVDWVSDDDPGRTLIGQKSARLLRSLVTTRINSVPESSGTEEGVE